MAQFDWSSCFDTTVTNADGVATIKCLEPLFKNLVYSIMALAGVGLFVMVVIGGFNFLMAGGDPKKMERARATLTGAITGIIIIAVAYLILLLIKQITGVDVTQFIIHWKEN